MIYDLCYYAHDFVAIEVVVSRSRAVTHFQNASQKSTPDDFNSTDTPLPLPPTAQPPAAMDGPPPPEEDFSQLPISDRLNHKNWKARVSAYDSLIKTFQNTASDSDPAFKPYISSPNTLKAAVTDANAVAQEKGVEMVATFVKYAGENAARTRDVVVPALVDKCFGSTRAGTKAQSLELVLLYVEVENSAAGVVVRLLVFAEACVVFDHERVPVRRTFSLASRQSNPKWCLELSQC